MRAFVICFVKSTFIELALGLKALGLKALELFVSAYPFSLLWYNVGTCKLVLGYVSPYGGVLALATQLLTNEVPTYYMIQLTYLDIA
jgi:hypothetical protein